MSRCQAMYNGQLCECLLGHTGPHINDNSDRWKNDDDTMEVPAILPNSDESDAQGQAAVAAVLRLLGEDPARDGLKDTPARVVRSWDELYAGYSDDPARYLATKFETSNSQMVNVGDIEFYSTCEHHMLPFFGTVDISYIPTTHVVGLSKFARVVNAYARRLQVQERLTNQIADIIQQHVVTLGVAVRIRAQHLCMMARGVKSPRSLTVTTALRGAMLSDHAARQEWLASLPK